jgi:hypothetical protein
MYTRASGTIMDSSLLVSSHLYASLLHGAYCLFLVYGVMALSKLKLRLKNETYSLKNMFP